MARKWFCMPINDLFLKMGKIYYLMMAAVLCSLAGCIENFGSICQTPSDQFPAPTIQIAWDGDDTGKVAGLTNCLMYSPDSKAFALDFSLGSRTIFSDNTSNDSTYTSLLPGICFNAPDAIGFVGLGAVWIDDDRNNKSLVELLTVIEVAWIFENRFTLGIRGELGESVGQSLGIIIGSRN